MTNDKVSADESESVAALTSISKTIVEVMLTANVVNPGLLDRIFAEQRDLYLTKKMPKAARILEHMRLFAIDPARERHRENPHPPRGADQRHTTKVLAGARTSSNCTAGGCGRIRRQPELSR